MKRTTVIKLTMAICIAILTIGCAELDMTDYTARSRDNLWDMSAVARINFSAWGEWAGRGFDVSKTATGAVAYYGSFDPRREPESEALISEISADEWQKVIDELHDIGVKHGFDRSDVSQFFCKGARCYTERLFLGLEILYAPSYRGGWYINVLSQYEDTLTHMSSNYDSPEINEHFLNYIVDFRNMLKTKTQAINSIMNGTKDDYTGYALEDGVLFNEDKTILIKYPANKRGAYVIPPGIIRIGIDAFSGCTGLMSITFGDNVAEIGERAFYGCTGLSSVTIPFNVKAIGNDAFRNIFDMTSVTIENCATVIGANAFYARTPVNIIADSARCNPQNDTQSDTARNTSAVVIQNNSVNYRDTPWELMTYYITTHGITTLGAKIDILRLASAGFSIYGFTAWLYLLLGFILKKFRYWESKKGKIALMTISSIAMFLFWWIIFLGREYKHFSYTSHILLIFFWGGQISVVAMMFYRLFGYFSKQSRKLPIANIILAICFIAIFAVLVSVEKSFL